MNLRVVNLVLVTALLAIAISAQETFKVKESTAKAEKAKSEVGHHVVGSHHRELTLRQRHQLGLTISSVRESYKILKESGEITEESSDAEISAAIALDIGRKNQQVFSAQASLDWEAIIAWIERILEILKLFV